MNASERKIDELGELKLIHLIADILGSLGSKTLPGEDDAVAVAFSDVNDSNLVINNDMLVSTTDVPKQMNLFQAGRKSVVMTASDVIVKGARPKWAVVSLGLPKNLLVDGNYGFAGLIKGLKDGFDEYNIVYLGGDLNESKEIIVSCTIIGVCPKSQKIIPRAGAKVGDSIVITDELGKTGCGFHILLNKADTKVLTTEQKTKFIDSVLKPSTPKDHAIILAEKGWVNASVDSSDGIQKSLFEICKVSKVGAELEFEKLPISDGVREFTSEQKIELEDVLFRAGEEFLHVFIIPSDKIKAAKSFFEGKDYDFYKIGKITADINQISVKNKGGSIKTLDPQLMGYNHFLREEEDSTDRGANRELKEKSTEATQTKKGKKSAKAVQQKKTLINNDMPGYHQYSGACGLTSLLMALKPESRGIDKTLDEIWEYMIPIFGKHGRSSRPYNWQRVLEWLLFQIARNTELQKIMEKEFGSNFHEGMLPVLKYRINDVYSKGFHKKKRNRQQSNKQSKGSPKKQPKNKNPSHNTKNQSETNENSQEETNSKIKKPSEPEIDSGWLMKRVYVWKMDFELELLAFLFGCRFIPWPKTQDGTGAIFFDRIELNKQPSIFHEKMDFMIPYINKGGPVLCCASVHWLAIKEIKQIKNSDSRYLIRYNDPASAREHRRTLNSLASSERFYIFEFDPELLKKNEKIIKELILSV
ncbi:MAG: thiamine-phosphate kinase [Candidatus Lokiarchaeota archaeon]|nr:thiamine-phosphate kinase [Candidatus Lokiarchaeota archaeon]